MHIPHGHTRNLCPCLVGVCVVVQKLVAEHKSYRHQFVLAIWAALDVLIETFEFVDEEKR
jgi:hypothetical protein